jgi:sigma-E factor negative regulatory protein RseA
MIDGALAMQKSIESAAKDTDCSLLAEALSAWMDGQGLPPGVSQEELVQWLLDDAEAQQKWRLWHAGADCLRAAQTHAEKAPGHLAVGFPAWSARLQERLSDIVMDDSEPKVASAPLVVAACAIVPAATPATNDSFWPWKMAAGFASLVAVGMVAWNLMGQPLAPSANRSLVVMRSNPVDVPVAVRASSGPEQMQEASARRAIDSTAAPDTYTEALILAHAQLGEHVLLQDALLKNERDSF